MPIWLRMGLGVAVALAAFSFSSTIAAQTFPEVTVLETNPITSEGDHTNPARLTLVRSGFTTSSLAVNLLMGGTATPGTDYLPIPSSITIPAGQASYEIAIFPYEGSLAEGTETIIVTVETGTGYTVANPATATAKVFDTQYDAWKFHEFTPGQLADAEISGPAADPDTDSTSNLGEFFAGSDPLTFDLGPVAELVETNGQFHLSIRRNPAAFALAVQIEDSATLSSWGPLVPPPIMNVETVDGWDYLDFPMPRPVPGDPRRFWRARINEPSPEIYDYYVDAVNGSDSNDGLTPDNAFQTIAAAQAFLSEGKSIALARGSVWREMLKPAARVRIGNFGEGIFPVLDAADVISPGNFSLSSHANAAGVVYETTLSRGPFGSYRG